jgi:hypothetical protein
MPFRFDPNGIQLGSKCVLYQGLAQQTSWFAHKREGFGPPLFDSGLDAVRTYGIDGFCRKFSFGTYLEYDSPLR